MKIVLLFLLYLRTTSLKVFNSDIRSIILIHFFNLLFTKMSSLIHFQLYALREMNRHRVLEEGTTVNMFCKKVVYCIWSFSYLCYESCRLRFLTCILIILIMRQSVVLLAYLCELAAL